MTNFLKTAIDVLEQYQTGRVETNRPSLAFEEFTTDDVFQAADGMTDRAR